MTLEREVERDEYHRTIEELIHRCEELKKEKEKSDQVMMQQKSDMEDMMESLVSTSRLKEEIMRRSQASESELQVAVDKVRIYLIV
jgi:hypothetical protein